MMHLLSPTDPNQEHPGAIGHGPYALSGSPRHRASASPPPPGPAEALCAAYLADPLRMPQEELPWSACNVQHLLDILSQNKVPLVSLPDPAGNLPSALRGSQPILSDPLFRAARQAEADELTALRAEYRLVHKALTAHGIAGVLCKSVGLQPSFPYKSDNLDVLYKPRDVEQVRAVLRQMGYVELTNMEEPLKYLFRKFHAGRSVSAIHLHEHVGWMTSFLDEEKLWQRCRPAPDDDWSTISAPEDALLTVLAHWFYEDKRLTLQDVAKYAHCLRQGVDWDELYRIASWRGWRDGLNTALLICSHQEGALYGQTLLPLPVLEQAWRDVSTGVRTVLQRLPGLCPAETGPLPHPSPAAVEGAPTALRIPFVFSKALSYAKLIRDPSRSWRRRIKDLAVHTAYGIKLRLHIHSQPAMLVTFSGIDGCGKTTQARALQSAFETCHLHVSYTWNRGGSAGWIAFLNRQIRHRRGVQHDEKSSPLATAAADKVHSRQQELRSPWKRMVWSWLTTIELLLQYARRVTLPLLRGRVVICDRYVYDALADWSAYFGEEAVEKCLAARVLRLLSPRPRCAYWLDVPAQVAQSRSPDGLPLRFLASQSAAYGRLAGLYALRRLSGDDRYCVSLPGGREPVYPVRPQEERGWEEVSDQVTYEVLSMYFSGYHTWINSLFLKNPGQWR